MADEHPFRPTTLGPNHLLGTIENSRKASARKKAGTAFEEELDDVHGLYLMRRRAKVERLWPATVVIGTGKTREIRFRDGGAPVDFGGTIAAAASPNGVPLPVWFDAKRASGAAWYEHDDRQRHQLEQLRDHRALGAVTFLLVQDAELELAYLVTAFDELLRVGRVRLREEFSREGMKKGERSGADDVVTPWPTIRRAPLFSTTDTPTWDWIAALPLVLEAA